MGIESLSVAERLGILEILPTRGSARELRVSAAIRKAVDFGQEETIRISLAREGDRITWDTDAASPVDVDFSTDGYALIRAVLARLDASEALSLSQLGLYDRFVPEG